MEFKAVHPEYTLEAGEGKMVDSSHEPSEVAQLADVCGLLTSGPIRRQKRCQAN